MHQTQLFVTDLGDPSVGIPELTWLIDSPILINDVNHLSEDEQENLEYFRNEVKKVYAEFAEGRIIADYDFETYEAAD